MTIGFVTINVGEQALIFNLDGQARLENGPKRLFLWREKFVPLRHHSANQNQYLDITYISGKKEHRPGPCWMYENPLEHCSIHVKEGTSLDANEVLVVYQRDDETKNVKRYLCQGPMVYIPKANEWLHEFCWHGTDPENKTRKIMGALKFTKLQVIPDQFYYNVDEVRTSDDALVRVKLMIFYELKDTERMLDTTQDPIADFVNCLIADVIAFAAKLQYLEFIEKSGELNDMKNFPQLMERCKVIGYEVSKVVFRGYYAIDSLQKMHDNAIQSRTRLKIEYEKEEQTQELTDMKLRGELERTVLEQSLELEQIKHKQEMERNELTHKLELAKKQNEQKIRLMRLQDDSKLRAEQAVHQQDVNHYQQLQGLGVQLTPYLLSINPQPQTVTRVVATPGAANLHLHQR